PDRLYGVAGYRSDGVGLCAGIEGRRPGDSVDQRGDRMSKPERGSLTTLLAKKPLGQGAPAAVPMEQAESALIDPDVQPDVRTPVQSVVQMDAPRRVADDGAGKGTAPE